MRGLSTEGNLRFKIDWASLIVGRKFTVFALFFFVFEGNFQVQGPQGGLYLEGLIHGAAYFRNFTVAANFCLTSGKEPLLAAASIMLNSLQRKLHD